MLLWLSFCNLAGQLVTLLVNFPTHHFLITPPLIATPSFCVILSNRHLTITLSLEVFGLILLVLTVIPPLRCVLKWDSSIPCMVHNLSFPPRQSVNDGIKPDTYLDAPFKLHLPGLDKLVEFINSKGVGCLVFKKDLTHAYQKIPVDPQDYPLLGFTVNGQFYFHTVMPFRLHLATLNANTQQEPSCVFLVNKGFLSMSILTTFMALTLLRMLLTRFLAWLSYLESLDNNHRLIKTPHPLTKWLVSLCTWTHSLWLYLFLIFASTNF